MFPIFPLGSRSIAVTVRIPAAGFATDTRVTGCLNRHQKPALRDTGLPAFGSMLRLRGWVGQSIEPRGR